MLFNNELNDILTSNQIGNSSININNETKIDMQGVINAINNKVGIQIVEDKNGRAIYEMKQGQRIKLQNARLNVRGYEI